MPPRQSPVPARVRCPRGVHCPPWLDRHGRRLLVAVDSRGRRIAEVGVAPWVDYRAAWRDLAAFLDREDPAPVLRLVKADAPAAASPTSELARMSLGAAAALLKSRAAG